MRAITFVRRRGGDRKMPRFRNWVTRIISYYYTAYYVTINIDARPDGYHGSNTRRALSYHNTTTTEYKISHYQFIASDSGAPFKNAAALVVFRRRRLLWDFRHARPPQRLPSYRYRNRRLVANEATVCENVLADEQIMRAVLYLPAHLEASLNTFRVLRMRL